MRVFERLLIVAAPVMIFLNVLGPIVSGVWLLILGEWKLVLITFAITALIAVRLIGFALLPQFAISASALYFAKRQNAVMTYFFAALSHLYCASLMVVWSYAALYFVVPSDALDSFTTAAPHLIWAYSIAASPWTYIALHEQNEQATPGQILCIFLQLGLIFAILILLFFDLPLTIAALAIALTMMIAVSIVVPAAGHIMLIGAAYDTLNQKVESLTKSK